MSYKWLKNILAFVLIGLLFYLVDLRELGQALSSLTLFNIALLLFISLVLIYVSTLKWSLFLKRTGDGKDSPSVIKLFGLYLLGYFVNLLLPSYVGGDITRSYYAGKQVGQHAAMSATILERYTGLVAMLTLACVGMWFSKLVTFQVMVFIVLCSLVLVGSTIIALTAWSPHFISKIKFLNKFTHHIKLVQNGFLLARKDGFLLLKTLILSFLFHSLTVVNTIVAAHAVGWDMATPGDLFVVLPIILLIGSLPISPSGLGIQEGAFFYFLQGIGATPAQALGVGVVLRAKSYILAFCGGIIWWRIERNKPKSLWQ